MGESGWLSIYSFNSPHRLLLFPALHDSVVVFFPGQGDEGITRGVDWWRRWRRWRAGGLIVLSDLMEASSLRGNGLRKEIEG